MSTVGWQIGRPARPVHVMQKYAIRVLVHCDRLANGPRRLFLYILAVLARLQFHNDSDQLADHNDLDQPATAARRACAGAASLRRAGRGPLLGLSRYPSLLTRSRRYPGLNSEPGASPWPQPLSESTDSE